MTRSEPHSAPSASKISIQPQLAIPQTKRPTAFLQERLAIPSGVPACMDSSSFARV